MTLRLKIILALIAVFSLYVSADWAIQRSAIFPRFMALEAEQARQDLQRCHQAISRDIEHLATFGQQLASIDAIRRNLQTPEDRRIEANVFKLLLPSSGLDFVAVLDSKHDVVLRTSRLENSMQSLLLEQFPEDRWPSDHPLLQSNNNVQSLDAEATPVQGMLMTKAGPLLVVACPVKAIQSSPSFLSSPCGTLVVGSLLSKGRLAAISRQTQVDFHIYPVDEESGELNSRLKNGEKCLNELIQLAADHDALLSTSPMLTEEYSSRQLKVYSYLADLTGKPFLLTEANIDRQISLQGAQVMNFAMGSLFIAALVFLVILLILLQYIVIGPLTVLTCQASTIGTTGDLTVRANIRRSDEIGRLAKQFDSMVQQVSNSQKRLLDDSRAAGMSDAAKGMLHNIGNVLTNISVLGESLTEQLRKSKLPSVGKLAQRIEEEDDLYSFLSTDERGKQFPTLLGQLAQHLEQQRHTMISQCESLSLNLRHAQQILESQRELATGASVMEATDLYELLHDVREILSASLARYGVTVNIQGTPLPSVLIDRNKLTQVLVNLVGNARDAVRDLPAERRQIELRLKTTDQQVIVEVCDQGCGIEPENVQRIFAGGFTTKPDGHGQGLHYCVLAAQELEGSLYAESDGADQGAIFSLSLPLHPAQGVAV
ncbi:MAG: HAMP domain-containing protein [Planctomycetales bacterium]|nr:HAMP domain-containing protein [Planctomycetales bacterium]